MESARSVARGITLQRDAGGVVGQLLVGWHPVRDVRRVILDGDRADGRVADRSAWTLASTHAAKPSTKRSAWSVASPESNEPPSGSRGPCSTMTSACVVSWTSWALVHARRADRVNERRRGSTVRGRARYICIFGGSIDRRDVVGQQRHRGGPQIDAQRHARAVPGVDECVGVDVLAQRALRGLVNVARAPRAPMVDRRAKIVWPPAWKMRNEPRALMVCARVPRLTKRP